MEKDEVKMETEICHNCKREVPQNNYLMHVTHCARNMAVCPVCGDAVPKAHLREHRAQQHSLVECSACQHKVQSGAMERHRATACPMRPAACPYCQLELPHSQMDEHENYCGSRTERCATCGELVMLKYQTLHVDSNHGFLKLDDEPGPTPSWEAPPPTRRQSPLDMLSVAASLPRPALRNVNTAPPLADKTDYKTPLSAGEGARDTLRSYVLPYDPTEDLRAKVKLARHDLNELKHSVLLAEGARGAAAAAAAKQRNDRPADVNLAAGGAPRDKLPAAKGYYNYLGENVPQAPQVQPQAPLPAKLDNERRAAGAGAGAPAQPSSPPRRESGAVPRATRRRAPPPPVSVARSSPPPPDEVSLPCEFCDTMVRASELVQHETGCRPDLAQLRSEKPSPAPFYSAPSPDVQLPCEFCCDLFPASKLLSHQARCDV